MISIIMKSDPRIISDGCVCYQSIYLSKDDKCQS